MHLDCSVTWTKKVKYTSSKIQLNACNNDEKLSINIYISYICFGAVRTGHRIRKLFLFSKSYKMEFSKIMQNHWIRLKRYLNYSCSWESNGGCFACHAGNDLNFWSAFTIVQLFFPVYMQWIHNGRDSNPKF